MFSAKVGEKSKCFTSKVGVAIFAFLFVTILGPGLLNLDSNQALAKSKGGCETIAKNVKKACNAEITDDYYIAIGKCNNIADKDQRAECKEKAKAERKDAREECKDQKEARIDLCEDLEEDFYNPVLDLADFVDPATINAGNANPYWPLVPGYMWTYKNRDATDTITETNTVEVLAGETVMIQGIECAVVHDIVYEGDTTDPDFIIEDTYDWYAQHDDGTVWYMGEFSLSKQECDEETGEFCEGLFGDDGSWQAGFDGGRGGVVMFADPSAVADGTVYRQELYLGEAEDAAQKVNFNVESVTVPMGGGTTYDTNVLKNYEFSVLEPGVAENKYYAPGVGLLREEAIEDDVLTGERVELVEFSTP